MDMEGDGRDFKRSVFCFSCPVQVGCLTFLQFRERGFRFFNGFSGDCVVDDFLDLAVVRIELGRCAGS